MLCTKREKINILRLNELIEVTIDESGYLLGFRIELIYDLSVDFFGERIHWFVVLVACWFIFVRP